MFKIGEFSKLTQTSIRMLRYYDETGLLKPAEVDRWTGHRLYSAEQIPRLNKILYLRDSGFQVAEIALALEMDDSSLLKSLEQKRFEIERSIQSQKERLRRIAVAQKEIQQSRGDLHYNISMRSVPAYQVLSLRRVLPDYYAEGDLWKELSAFAKERNIELASPTFSIYHDTEDQERDVDVELCAPVREVRASMEPFRFRITEPVRTMACTMVYGDFSLIARAYAAFAEWLQRNGAYRMTGPTRQIVHRGPWNEKNPERYLTELQIPLH